MEAKYARMKEGGLNPLIDPGGYKTFVAQKEQEFRAELAKQKAAGATSEGKHFYDLEYTLKTP
jgi:hypothetical protein